MDGQPIPNPIPYLKKHTINPSFLLRTLCKKPITVHTPFPTVTKFKFETQILKTIEFHQIPLLLLHPNPKTLSLLQGNAPFPALRNKQDFPSSHGRDPIRPRFPRNASWFRGRSTLKPRSQRLFIGRGRWVFGGFHALRFGFETNPYWINKTQLHMYVPISALGFIFLNWMVFFGFWLKLQAKHLKIRSGSLGLTFPSKLDYLAVYLIFQVLNIRAFQRFGHACAFPSVNFRGIWLMVKIKIKWNEP